MPKFSITEKQLEDLKKSLLDGVTDKARVEAIEKSFDGLGELEEVEVEKTNDEPTGDADPIADVMLGVFEGLKKARGDADVQAIIDAAYAELGAINQKTAEAAFVAGEQTGLSKRGKKPAAADGEDGEDGEDHEDDGDEDDMKKILKGVKGPLRKFMEGVLKANGTLQEKVNELTTERDNAALRKMAEEAGEGSAFADLLKSIADPKAREQVAKMAKTKNETLKKSNLFKEVGGGSPADGGSALEKLNAHAQEIVKNSGGKVKFAKAFTQASSEHPDLYVEYSRETYGR